ncbi:N-glycosylase/DNA lyase [Diabrotica virgifera virgifera]|uniref:DNA-(apurinic or apyrimidinic site) lyase n=1 Tax=Diabrotica virgifera virgifera TaxID=50390 RepID=A0ABM5IRZ9_DIAVI|nr:N-glycosylase/DNA lyase [Diabrotica virgifera virgifera]
MKSNWYRLLCKKSELQLLGSLNGGQSFRWKKHPKNEDQWIGVFANKVWILKQEEDCINYQVFEPKANKSEPMETYYNSLLKDYFQLDLNLTKYYAEWSECDKYFKEAAKQFYGIRILKQDVVENIFSFICSSNNHITRISGMVEKLAKFYGNEICEVEGEMYYSFPNVEQLAGNKVEDKLRTNGFGYRSKYISKSAQYIAEQGGNDWLVKLKNMPYDDAKKSLMELTGVGAKVADCICLMSLGHLQAIPVDTHIYQIAKRLYMPSLPNNKTVTEKVYNDIGDNFRKLYGPLAGWAHTVLFCADLKKFQGNNLEENERDTKPKKKLKSTK